MKPKKFQRPEDYLVIFFTTDKEYPIIERKSRSEIKELRQDANFKDIAVIEGSVIKGFGSANWSAM